MRALPTLRDQYKAQCCVHQAEAWRVGRMDISVWHEAIEGGAKAFTSCVANPIKAFPQCSALS